MTFISPQGYTLAELDSGTFFAPKLDANGLILAITTDADTNELLMAAYMNEESIRLTFETGFVHYYSRSRKNLWKKGESSGELQQFVEMRVDCDQDILQVRAYQLGSGAACHTGRRSCFYRSVEIADGDANLNFIGMEPLFDPKEKYGK